MISGEGFAIANTTAPLAMERTISADSTSFALTPTNTSASFTASASVPLTPRGFVFAASAVCAELNTSPSSVSTPALSHTTMSPAPAASRNSAIAIPALPAPLITIRAVESSFPTTLSAFSSAAASTIAVPC